MRKKYKENNTNIKIGRLRFVIAIIFLLFLALIYKLFDIQINKCDWYTALASSQHQMYSKLTPKRGKIFFSSLGEEAKKYPFVSNKEFASVFIIPKDVKEAEMLANKFFDFFDREEVEKEVEKEMKNKKLQADKEELQLIKQGKIEEKKKPYLDKYLKRFNKPNDPYEPLADKVNLDSLLQLYANILSTDDHQVKASDLEIKGERIINKETGEIVNIPGLSFVLKEYRYYPEKELGAHIVGFVSSNDKEQHGHYGLEGFFDDELFGEYGSLHSERGGQNSTIIVNNRKYDKPKDGSDLILTIDRNIEFKVCEELKKGIEKWEADGGTVIVMNPKTGAIIAMCSFPSFNPNNYNEVENIDVYNNPAIFYQYEPGSVFKTITMAIAIDQNKITPSTLYNDKGEIMIKGWPKPIKNADFFSHGPHGLVDMNTVLEKSLNTGAIFAMKKVGPKIFADYIRKFGFGEKTGIELGSESSGDISNLLRSKVREIDAATASFGQGIAVTPLQILMAYQAIANHGIMMKPYIVQKIVKSDGKVEEIKPKAIGPVISEKTAYIVSAMLVNVIEKGHAVLAKIPGYYIGGKTGTAQVAISGGYSEDKYIHTFIGIVPIDDPAFVMLVKLNNPKKVKYSASSAVPLWHDIADYIIKYYCLPKNK